MDSTELVGWLGTVSILIVFGAGALGLLAADTVQYQLLNIFACLCVGYFCIRKGIEERALLNGIWLLVGIIAIVRLFL